jgi:hypothetical protein
VNIQSNPDKTWKKSFPPTFCSILLTAKEKKDLHKNQKKKIEISSLPLST